MILYIDRWSIISLRPCTRTCSIKHCLIMKSTCIVFVHFLQYSDRQQNTAWLAQSHLILMNTQRERMKYKKSFVFNIITNQSVQKGASVLFMLIQLLLFFLLHHAEQCCNQSCYCQPVSSGCLYWSAMWCYWNPVVAPRRYMLNWLRPTGSLKIWRDEVRPEASLKK